MHKSLRACSCAVVSAVRSSSFQPLQRIQHRQPNRNNHVQHSQRPLRLAIVGSGPAGFYTAYKVLSKIQNSKVDMYESLPVPYGLVRFGVAPDHPEVKNCEDTFAEAANSPNFEFIGNVAVGSTVPLEALQSHYDAIVFAYGASEDRQLGIPGENSLKGIYSARAFVGWYNGLPEYAGLAPNLESGEDATIIGQGNVALDVARTLLMDVKALRQTDMAEYAVDALSRSKVKRVRVVGRRGPVQAAFTTKEVRELMNITNVGFKPLDTTYLPSPEDTQILPRTQKRIMQVLAKGSTQAYHQAQKSWELDFLLSPRSFNSASSTSTDLSSITFSRTAYTTDSSPLSISAKIEATDTLTTFPTEIAFRSIGYKSAPIPGLSNLGVPFDTTRGIIPHDASGRAVIHSNADQGHGGDILSLVPGIYCAGWVKSGPNGVIAHTMEDAFGTAEAIAKDWASGKPFIGGERTGVKAGWEGVLAGLPGREKVRRVSWSDWQKINVAERKRGSENGKEREKFASVEEMLGVLR